MESWILSAGITRGSRIASRLKKMSEDIKPTPDPLPPREANHAGAIVLWLVFAFVPSFVAIPIVTARNAPQFTGPGLLFLAAACCLCSGFGVLSGVKSQAARIILGLFLSGIFFVLNVFIVALVGCAKM
jgi:hypothetical protein